MFIAVLLIVIIGCWFQFGIFTSLFLMLCASIGLAWHSKAQGAISLLACVIIILVLEASFSHVLPREYQHTQQSLTACIAKPVSEYDDYISAFAEIVEQPSDLALRFIRLSIAKPFDAETLKPGSCIEGQFRLRQPLGRIIPGSFHADSYNFSQHIDAYAALSSINSMSFDPASAMKLFNARKVLFTSDVYSGMWSALTLGWSGSIAPDTKSLLLDNQLMHLFVVSGMHVGFILFLAIGLIRIALKPFSRFVHLSFLSQAIFASSILALYLWLLGYPVPAVRATIMTLIPLFIHILRLNTPWWTGLAFASVVISIWRPASWLTVGTWLSFCSVLFIVLLFRWRLINKNNWLIGFLTFQILMSAMLLPWSVVFGFDLNPFSFILNILATPFIAFLLLPLSLLIAALPLSIFVNLFELAVSLLLAVLSTSSPFHKQPEWLSVYIVLLVVFCLGGLAWFRHRLIAVSGIIVAGVVSGFIYYFDTQTQEQITVFDVGHGQSILIETGDERWLYDTGGQVSSTLSVFEFYLARTVGKLDGVITSHSDLDHAAGLNFIMADQPHIKAISGQPRRHALMPPFTPINCHTLSNITPTLRFISIPNSLQSSNNDSSCVLVYSYNNRRMIITGDASRQVEYYLLQTYPEIVPFDVVIAGHHGSQTSSAEAWLQSNEQAIFMVSTSDRARPKWPSSQFLSWFEKNSLPFWSTAIMGTMTIDFKQKELSVRHNQSAFRHRLLTTAALNKGPLISTLKKVILKLSTKVPW